MCAGAPRMLRQFAAARTSANCRKIRGVTVGCRSVREQPTGSANRQTDPPPHSRPEPPRNREAVASAWWSVMPAT